MRPVAINVRQEVSQRRIATHRPRTAPINKDGGTIQRAPSPDRPESAAKWRKSGPSLEVAKSLWYDESLNKDFVLASIYSQEEVEIPESPAKDSEHSNNLFKPTSRKSSPGLEGSVLSQMCHEFINQHPDLIPNSVPESSQFDNLQNESSFHENGYKLPKPDQSPNHSSLETARSKSIVSVNVVDLGSALESDAVPFTSPQVQAQLQKQISALNQQSEELSIGTATQELSKHNASGIIPTMMSEEDKTRMNFSAQRFFFDMWLADHGKQIGTEDGLSSTAALNIELLMKLDHSLRQAAFEFEQQQEEMSLLSQHQPSGTQQIDYIKKITTTAIEVLDRLVKEMGNSFPLLRTLRRALMPSIFVRHASGIVNDDDDLSLISAKQVSVTEEKEDQSLVVERWIRAEESIEHLTSVHEGLTKDFARINHELNECKRLLAVQEEKYQTMARAQAKTFEDLKDSNQERLKYLSEVKILKEELSLTKQRWEDTQDARKSAENSYAEMQRQVNISLLKINGLETKVSEQAAVIEKFKKELNELKKERRETKKDLLDVQDKMKHLRHTLIHDRKETLQSFEKTKDFARKMCARFKLMESDEEDIAEPEFKEGARPKTIEELQEEEKHLLEMEFTDRAWQMGSYLEHTQNMLADEICRYEQIEKKQLESIEKLQLEKKKLIASHSAAVEALHVKYKAQLQAEEKSAELIQSSLRSQIQQKSNEVNDLRAAVQKQEDTLKILQQHCRRIEIELTNACTQAREQGDTLNMLKEDKRADDKIVRKEARILEVESMLRDCTTQLHDRELKLAEAKQKLEAEETAAIQLTATWEKKYRDDMKAQENRFVAELKLKQAKMNSVLDKLGMMSEDVTENNKHKAEIQQKLNDVAFEAKQNRLSIQAKNSEIGSLRSHIKQVEEMFMIAQATVEDLTAQLTLVRAGRNIPRNISSPLQSSASQADSTNVGMRVGSQIESNIDPTGDNSGLIPSSPDDANSSPALRMLSTKMQLMKGMAPNSRSLTSPMMMMQDRAISPPGTMGTFGMFDGPRKEFVTKTVQTDEMGDMFAFVATKYKSVTISAKNSPEAWEYLAVRMYQERAKIQETAQYFLREKKAIEQELNRLREENQEIIAKIPSLINSHIDHMTGLKMMEMVKEEAERRIHESSQQQMRELSQKQLSTVTPPSINDDQTPSPNKSSEESALSPDVAGSVALYLDLPSSSKDESFTTPSPPKLEMVDISFLYKLTQKIKKTLDWKKSVLPSNVIYGFRNDDDYEEAHEDEDEFDDTSLSKPKVQVKRKITDVDVEPFHPKKLERRTQLRQFTTSKYYNRGTQTWDDESIVSSRFHNHLLERGSTYHVEKSKVMFPHRAQSDIEYSKLLLQMSPKQLSQPFIGYIRMHEKQYAREVGLMKVALRECRGMYEKLLLKIQDYKTKLSAEEDSLVLASWKDMEGSLKEYNWIFDPKAFIGRLVIGRNEGGNLFGEDADADESNIFDDEDMEVTDKKRKKSVKKGSKTKSSMDSTQGKPHTNASISVGHMDPIDIAAQARMIVSYRQALDSERDLIAQGITTTSEGTDRSLVIHTIEDLIVDLHTRMELHGGWQSLLYRSDGSVDYDMDFGAFSSEEQKEILLEQKKLLRIQLQSDHERSLKEQEHLLWELKRYRKQEQRRAQLRGSSSNLGASSGMGGNDLDDDVADVGVQTVSNWKLLQPATYQLVQKTLAKVIDILRYAATTAVSSASVEESRLGFAQTNMAVSPLLQPELSLASAPRIAPQLPPLNRQPYSSHRPKTACTGTGSKGDLSASSAFGGGNHHVKSDVKAAASNEKMATPSFITDYSLNKADINASNDSKYLSFVRKKPLLQSISPIANDSKHDFGSRKGNKGRPWSSAQWQKVKDGAMQQYPQLQPLLVSSSMSQLSTMPSFHTQLSQHSLQQESQEFVAGVERMSIFAPNQGNTAAMIEPGSSSIDLFGLTSQSLCQEQSLTQLSVEGHPKLMIARKDLLSESTIEIYEHLLEQKKQEEFRAKLIKEEKERKAQEAATMTLVTEDLSSIYQVGDKILMVSQKDNVNSEVENSLMARNRSSSQDNAENLGYYSDYAFQDPWQLKYQMQTAHSLCEQLFHQLHSHTVSANESGKAAQPTVPATTQRGRLDPQPSIQFTDSIATVDKSHREEDVMLAIGEAALDDGASVALTASPTLTPRPNNNTSLRPPVDSPVFLAPDEIKRVHFSNDAPKDAPAHGAPTPDAEATHTIGVNTAPNNQINLPNDVDASKKSKTEDYEAILQSVLQEPVDVSRAKPAVFNKFDRRSADKTIPFKPAMASLLHSLAKKQRNPSEPSHSPYATDLMHHAIQLYDSYGEHWQALQRCEERLRQLQQSHGHLTDLRSFLSVTGLDQLSSMGNQNCDGFSSVDEARNHYANKLLYKRLSEQFHAPSPKATDLAQKISMQPLASLVDEAAASSMGQAGEAILTGDMEVSNPGIYLHANRNPVVTAFVQNVTAPTLMTNGQRRHSSRASFSHSTFAIQALANTSLMQPQPQQDAALAPAQRSISSHITSVESEIHPSVERTVVVPGATLEQESMPVNEEDGSSLPTTRTSLVLRQPSPTAPQTSSIKVSIPTASPQSRRPPSHKLATAAMLMSSSSSSSSSKSGPTNSGNTTAVVAEPDDGTPQSRLRRSFSLARGASAKLGVPSPGKIGGGSTTPATGRKKSKSVSMKVGHGDEGAKPSSKKKKSSFLSKAASSDASETYLHEVADLVAAQQQSTISIADENSLVAPGEVFDAVEDEEDLFATLDALEEAESAAEFMALPHEGSEPYLELPSIDEAGPNLVDVDAVTAMEEM